MRKTKSGEGVLALDLGTSSVRAVVYDTRGQMVAPTLCDLPYKVRTTDPGEVSSNPDDLVRLIATSGAPQTYASKAAWYASAEVSA